MKSWRLTPAAENDLSDIWLHTADRWGIDQANSYTLCIEHDLTAAANGSPLVRPIGDLMRIKSGHHFCVFDKTATAR